MPASPYVQLLGPGKHPRQAMVRQTEYHQRKDTHEGTVGSPGDPITRCFRPVLSDAYPIRSNFLSNRKSEDWNEWDQMDAHELLRFLLDRVSMEEFDVGLI